MNMQKKQTLGKSPMHNSQAQFQKFSHGSPDSRDLNTRDTFTKRSKDKMPKQPSSTLFKHMRSDTSDTAKRPTSFITTTQLGNCRRSAANVHEVDYRRHHHNTLQDLELADSVGKSSKYRQVATEGPEKVSSRVGEELPRTGSTGNVLKCHFHPVKDAKYLVEINQDEDILCCMECGTNMAAKGCDLEEISSVKSKRNYELDEFLQKSLQSMQTLRQCLKHLPQHQSNFKAELKQQMEAHQSYYNKLMECLLKKKDQTQKILMNCLNNIMQQFGSMHKNLHTHLSELETNYNEIIVNRQDIRRMNEADFSRIIKKYQTKLIIQQKALNPEIQIWKVKLIQPVNFQKDIEKYFIKVEQQIANTQQTLKSIGESVDQIRNDESSGLLCEESFEWGYKLPKSPSVQPSQDIYFSFEKKNCEGSASSPTFKQI